MNASSDDKSWWRNRWIDKTIFIFQKSYFGCFFFFFRQPFELLRLFLFFFLSWFLDLLEFFALLCFFAPFPFLWLCDFLWPVAPFEPRSSKLLIASSTAFVIAKSKILERYFLNPISLSCLNEWFLHLKIPHLCDLCDLWVCAPV